jgi:hypothetical protein
MNDNDLYDIIKKQFQTYTDDVVKEIKKSAKKISLNAMREVKEKSPQDTGEYSQKWSRNTIEKDDGIYIMVHQKKKPTLTHLLEKGHKSRNGSKVAGIEHIAPVEEKANEEFSKKIDEIIQKHSKD